jgi:hypothetical protein
MRLGLTPRVKNEAMPTKTRKSKGLRELKIPAFMSHEQGREGKGRARPGLPVKNNQGIGKSHSGVDVSVSLTFLRQ